jgi:transcriptional regulator with XRE-family HTH domain
MTKGERIKYRREQLGMTQDELAQKIGFKSRSSIQKIENGVQDLVQSKIKALADALYTTPSYIMGWTDEDDSSEIPATGTGSGLEKEILDLISDLSEAGQQEVLNFARYVSSRERN